MKAKVTIELDYNANSVAVSVFLENKELIKFFGGIEETPMLAGVACHSDVSRLFFSEKLDSFIDDTQFEDLSVDEKVAAVHDGITSWARGRARMLIERLELAKLESDKKHDLARKLTYTMSLEI